MSFRDRISLLLSRLNGKSNLGRNRKREQRRRLLFERMEDRRVFATIDLASLSVSQGSTINGAAAQEYSGSSVSNAGDVNGDGFDDLIIGGYKDPGTPLLGRAGKSYVIFGGSSLPTTIALSNNLGTTNPGVGGFTILGQAVDDFSGRSVSSAGDVNGDGFDDLIVGADHAAPAGRNNAGQSYVIFGKADWSTTPTINLASNNLGQAGGPAGFTILGQAAFDFSGRSVSSAGDVNGDGFDDLIVGANFASPANLAANSAAGKSYVIFGGSSLPATITLSDRLSTTNPGVGGVTILGQAANDDSGSSVSNAGDVNGDGFDDLIVGANRADPGSPARNFAGKTYVIFGGSSLPATITLSDRLSTTNPGVGGFTILGQVASDLSGRSVSSAGDVNGDGFDDLIVGAHNADPAGRNYAGTSYVIFGKADWSTTPTIDLASNTLGRSGGPAGFTILGQAADDRSGISVSSAGDVNGDGFDDIIVGASGADPGTRDLAGKSYVIFGRSSLPATITLSDRLSTTNPGVGGVTILGQAANDLSGRSVSNAGDVNGDGFDDLIVGARSGSLSTGTKAGKSYVIFGGNGFTNSILAANLGNSSANTINGTSAANILNGANGDDILVGLGGADILLGGRGNDILAVSDLNFKRIVGGNGTDTLRLDGTGLHLNLTTIRDNRIVDIEEINITGTGNNTLTLNQREVLNLSTTTNTLLVRRNSGDVVNRGSGWTQIANETISGTQFEVFTQGRAILKVQNNLAAPVIGFSTAPVTYAENAPPLAIFSSTTITDVDTPILSGGVLTITNTNGELTDRLTIASSSFVIVSGNSILIGSQVVGTFTGGTGTTPLVVTFTNQASLNRVVAILSLIRFSNISDAPSGVSRIISVRVTDGSGGTSAIVNRTVGVTPVVDAPIVTLPTTPVTYVENAAPLAIFSSANVTDADTPVLTGGVLTITNNNGDVNDRLSIVSSSFVIVSGNSILVGGQVVGTFTGGTGTTPLVVTFTSQASINRVLAVLSLIRFSNISDAPSSVSRIISVRVTDGAGGTSTTVNRTVGVTPVNDAPVISSIGPAVTYTKNGPRVLVFSGTTTITDLDNTVLTGGKLTIANTNGQATDSLAIIPNASITVSGANVFYNGSAIGTFTGGVGTTPLVFTFNSQATPARIRLVLLSVGFSNSSTTPSTTPRTISVQLTDGVGGTSALQSKMVNVV